jgi:cysteine desulfurase
MSIEVKNKIYLDNSATTALSPSVKEAMAAAMEIYGNPSSLHTAGDEAGRMLSVAREQIFSAAGFRQADGWRVIFTASGSEANNLALFSAARAKKHFPSKRILITDSEHPSVARAAERLGGEGFEIVEISTKGGALDMAQLRAEAMKGVFMASFMLVNNETGALYDIKALNVLRKKLCPSAVLHTDAVQAFGKTKEALCLCGADLISISGHKVHAPKGIGALYIKNGTRIVPNLIGGGQEKDIRPGTEALPNIAAFAAACEEVFDINNIIKVEKVNEYLANRIEKELPEVKINKPEKALPHVISITLPSIKSEVMLRFLSSRYVYVSAGSACTSKHKENRVLKSFGLDSKSADCTIRISFSELNTTEEADIFINELSNGINSLVTMK